MRPNQRQRTLAKQRALTNWLPSKTVAQKDRLEEESKTIAMKVLAEGPEERAKRMKKDLKDLKVVRVIKEVPVKFDSCKSSGITNKCQYWHMMLKSANWM